MTPVIIESPLAAPTPEGEATNRRYLQACLLDCLRRGETPYASHGLLPGALDDAKPEEREAGILAGFHMAAALHQLGAPRAVYTDCGISGGMRRGIEHAERIGQRVEHRVVPGWGR